MAPILKFPTIPDYGHWTQDIVDLFNETERGNMKARKETRGGRGMSSGHIRIDYPERDLSWDDMLTYQRMEDGKAVLETRKVTPLNMELKEER